MPKEVWKEGKDETGVERNIERKGGIKRRKPLEFKM